MKKRFLLLFLAALYSLAGLVLAQTPTSGTGQGQGNKDAASPSQQPKQRRDEGRPATPAQPAQDASQRSSRLSPEERKELRQQIHEAGDVYPRKRGAP